MASTLPSPATPSTASSSSPPAREVRFGGLRIEYDDRVLRPRAWTEQQSRWAADLLAAGPGGGVLELCAGVGHIGLLAISQERRPLIAVDRSPVACRHARRNAARAGLAELVEVREGDLQGALRPDERFALVIADPPWVRTDQVTDHPDDPRETVDGGEDGLDVARVCVEVGLRHLVPGGALLLQLGTRGQAEVLARECAAAAEVVEVRDGERGVLAVLRPAR